MVPGVISKDCGNWDKNRGVTKAMYRIEGCEDVEIFRNGSVHKFYRLKALITLEQVITSVVEKKYSLNDQNFDGEDNWSVVISFHCMQVSLLMSMRFIFGDDWNDASVHHVSLIFVYSRTLVTRPLNGNEIQSELAGNSSYRGKFH